MRDQSIILEFQGEYRWLSNFHPVPVEYEGVIYPSSENAYQAAKTLDLEARKMFTNITAGQAKRAGRVLELREDWLDVRVQVMRNILIAKFRSGSELAEKLVRTGNRALIEGNKWGDTFWGVDLRTMTGENRLGILLEEIRHGLQREKEYDVVQDYVKTNMTSLGIKGY